MKSIYHLIRGYFKRKRRLTPEEMAKKLPEAVRAAVLGEAAFLRKAHGVEVRSLGAGEMPDKPKAADPEMEARLTAQPQEP